MARSIIVTGGFGILGHAVARIDFAAAPRVAISVALDHAVS